MSQHIMVDLETMGNHSDAAIIAIGAVAFDKNGVTSEFYRQVQLEDSVRQGMSVQPSTILWWLQQSDSARAAFRDNENACPLAAALLDFAKFVKAERGEGVWGNGASFDNVILTKAYQLTGIPTPWPFWQDRCYRTLKAMYAEQVPYSGVKGTAHNALDDARSQAVHLIQIINYMDSAKAVEDEL